MSIKDNGSTTKQTVKEYIRIPTGPNTQGNGKMIDRMERAFKNGWMDKDTKDSIKMARRQAKDYWNSWIQATTKGNFYKTKSMAKVQDMLYRSLRVVQE